MEHHYHETFDKGHGRIERQQHWHTQDIQGLGTAQRWSGSAGMTMCRATAVADIQKERWQIGLFFKALKENLKVKSFVGTTENAAKRGEVIASVIVQLSMTINEVLVTRETDGGAGCWCWTWGGLIFF